VEKGSRTFGCAGDVSPKVRTGSRSLSERVGFGSREEKKGVSVMELESYCQNVGAELMGWKAKLGGVVNEFDHISSGDKEKVIQQVRELHMILEELEDRIHRLKTECPTEFAAENIDVKGTFKPFTSKWENVWPGVSPGDIGG